MICVTLLALHIGLVGSDGAQNVSNSSQPNDIPSYVPLHFDCAMREFAMKFAQQQRLGPRWYNFTSTFQALQLGSRCGKIHTHQHTHWTSAAHVVQRTTLESLNVDELGSMTAAIYVDAERGSDGNPGSLASPVATVHKAVELSRSNGVKTVLIKAGTTQYMSATLVLDARDSGLVLGRYG
eukprot:m.1623184 g.1623184  ORF g.1623184 m.1623184 type:complete len:181 (-) comp25385_c0_seq6:8867-9409(-)